MDGAVVAQFLGQVVPLAAATEPEDDPFQHPPGIGTRTAHGLGWIGFTKERL
jgi:hypothetical protein